jgi:flagellar FliL protein
MAKDEGGGEAGAAAPKSKLVLILVIVLVVVLAAGGGAMFMLLNSGGKHKKNAAADDEEEGGHAKTAVVVLEEKFTVNLQAEDGSQHYLQVPKVELEVATPESAAKIEERKGKVSDRISGVLRARTLKDMQAAGSDMKLKEDLKTVINQALELKEGKGVKEVILPNSFIIQ